MTEEEKESLIISLIIPVYNTEELFLRECLNSALIQTYNNLEIIVVNDGCTDSSPEIIQEYAKKDFRFFLINKENGGLSSARNAGMKKAAGDYFMFLDSDDYLLSKTVVSDIAKLLGESKADILSYEYIEFFDNTEHPKFAKGNCPREEVYKKEPQSALKALLKRKRSCFSSSVCTKVVKAEFIHKNNISFQKGLYHEDVLYTSTLIRKAKTYDRYDMIVYALRRSNPASLTTSPDINKKIKMQQDMVSIFEKILSYNENQQNAELLNFLASPYAYWLGVVAGVSSRKNNEVMTIISNSISIMANYSFVLRYSPRANVKVIYILYAILGVKMTLKLLQVYLRLNNRHVLSINRKMS